MSSDIPAARHPVIVRPLASLEEYHVFEQTEQAIWGMPDREIIPSHLLLTIAKNTGLVLGAFSGDRMVGVLCGFLGRDALGWKHCSHVMGVLPEYRAQGVGSALKWAQRDAVLAQGLDRVTWTYDPLETPNARLNLHVLGAVCRRYLPNLYGDLPDALNAGLPTDRFEVDWWIASSRVAARARRRPDPPVSLPPAVNRVATEGRNGWPSPAGWDLPSDTEARVIVPADFQSLRRSDLALATEWRLQTRAIFTTLFEAGFVAEDFILDPDRRQAHYLLRKASAATDHPSPGESI
jgi:predicted GNAT superfamily acetyltransferase